MTYKQIIAIIIAILLIAVVGGYVGAKLVGGNQSVSTVGSAANNGYISTFNSVATSLGLIQTNGCSDNSDTGLETCVSIGSFAAATTTFLSLAPPMGTSTVNLVQLTNTGVATTSYTVLCGTSTTPYESTNTPVGGLISSGTVGTSTNFGVFLNGNKDWGLTGATSTANGSDKLQIKGNEYLVCKAKPLGGTGYNTAFTNTTETFAGSYRVRFVK